MCGCGVVGCGKNSSTPTLDLRYENRKITYHQFPSNEEVREKWLKALRDGGRVDDWVPNSNTKICSLHFAVEDIMVSNGKSSHIRKGAVPYIPVRETKKPPRKRRGAATEASEKLAEEISEPESILGPQDPAVLYEISLDNIPINPDAPGVSSDVYQLPAGLEPSAAKKPKKVVKMGDDHTFQARVEETAQDPCPGMQADMLESMKKFGEVMSIHHPDKVHKVKELMQKVGNIFRPEETEPMASYQDPYLGGDSAYGFEDPYLGGDSAYGLEAAGCTDLGESFSLTPEEEDLYLNNPEAFLGLSEHPV